MHKLTALPKENIDKQGGNRFIMMFIYNGQVFLPILTGGPYDLLGRGRPLPVLFVQSTKEDEHCRFLAFIGRQMGEIHLPRDKG